MNRRAFLKLVPATPWWVPSVLGANSGARPDTSAAWRSRIEGLLVGSLLGDALGGPIEFQDPAKVRSLADPPHAWTDGEVLDAVARRSAARRLRLRSYRDLRPVPEPFAHWAHDASPGTLTDDSRHKIVLLDALRAARKRGARRLEARGLAQAYLDWPKRKAMRRRPHLAHLSGDWLREWHLAARWVLGGRDLAEALPPERIWNGLPTCCGQMTLPPLAAVFPGDPASAYRAAFELAWFDNGWGKDLNAALVAGLAVALRAPSESPQRRSAWESIFDAMRRTDPFRYGQIPWVQRSVDRWLDLALASAAAAERRPARLFARLDEIFHDTIKWEAQVPFVVTFACLALCDYDPLPALQLSIEWGHDTDSYASLVGAFVGALHGVELFPAELGQAVVTRLRADYDEDVGAWARLLGEWRWA